MKKRKKQVLKKIPAKQFTIKSVADALKLSNPKSRHLRGLAKAGDFDQFWFRGQANASYPPVPSSLRRGAKGGFMYRETDMFIHFILRHPEYRKDHVSTFEWMCLMQHYGLPTRLLDWSEGILPALYFAVTDYGEGSKRTDGIVYCLNPFNLNEIALVYDVGALAGPDSEDVILRAETVYCEKIEDIKANVKQDYSNWERVFDAVKIHSQDTIQRLLAVPLAVYPSKSNPRMKVQDSVFTLHGGAYSRTVRKGFIRPPMDIMRLNRSIITTKRKPFLAGFKVPVSKKIEIREELRRLGVHEGTLFPELEHQASHLREIWKI